MWPIHDKLWSWWHHNSSEDIPRGSGVCASIYKALGLKTLPLKQNFPSYLKILRTRVSIPSLRCHFCLGAFAGWFAVFCCLLVFWSSSFPSFCLALIFSQSFTAEMKVLQFLVFSSFEQVQINWSWITQVLFFISWMKGRDELMMFL